MLADTAVWRSISKLRPVCPMAGQSDAVTALGRAVVLQVKVPAVCECYLKLLPGVLGRKKGMDSLAGSAVIAQGQMVSD